MTLVSVASLAGVASAPPVDQRYLFEARQIQALSLSVHIPLVCFGIAFPALVLFAEWRWPVRYGVRADRGAGREGLKTRCALVDLRHARAMIGGS